MLPDYIEITQNSTHYIDALLSSSNYSNIFILVDENSKKYCLPEFKNRLADAQLIEIKSGEEHKTLVTCGFIWQKLTEANADRNALLINLGGGIIGDMGGFCASTYKRGIDFINIPTTLLSQVDASIGGKLGIDFNGYKNHIGLFNLPTKVIIDSRFLKTLPTNQLRSGFAEMLKHGFIKDRVHLEDLSLLEIEKVDWASLIEKSVEIKNQIVAADPQEQNERKFLNFGHTIGHAIETYFLNNKIPILHGEAVAIGMIAETYLSVKKLELSEKEKESIILTVDRYFERKKIPFSGMNEILDNLEQDKKNINSEIHAVLLKAIGTPKHSIKISKNEVKESLVFYDTK